jgi:2-polyprenyl-3-methyl-5-hydroxy-6-metoxy-1,4-benzoquinol methylase
MHKKMIGSLNERQTLSGEMMTFLKSSPLTEDLYGTRDEDYIFHFEAPRALLVRNMLLKAGVGPLECFKVLDFGYLHGLTQEFLHRAFPNARLVVYDLPTAPIFSNPAYMQAIKERHYLELVPGRIEELPEDKAGYWVITLGEIVEHLDPTLVATVLAKLRRIIDPGTVLVVTTPNASGLYNCYMTMSGGDAIQVAPIPNKTHGYGHIHLWSPKLLKETAEHFGWSMLGIEYYHGREGEKFSEVRNKWVSLKAQILVRTVKLLGDRLPRLRGFFVAAFVAR